MGIQPPPTAKPNWPLAPTTKNIAPINGPVPTVPPQPTLISPRVIQRAKTPNLTGFYEQIPVDEGKQSAFTMQLHQVGSVIVGWFSPPPKFVINNWRTLTRSENENDFAVPFGIFIALASSSANGPYSVVWSAVSDGFPYNTGDPSSIVSAVSTITNFHRGQLEVVSASQGTFSELLFKFDVGSGSNDRLVRVKEDTRWPMSDIVFFPPEVRGALIAEQVLPIPTTFLAFLQSFVAPAGDPPNKPPLADAIKQWQLTPDSDKSAREVARTKVFNLLTMVDSAVKAATSPSHRRVITNAIVSHAASQLLPIDGDSRTYLRWLQAVMRDEINRRSQDPPPVGKDGNPLPPDLGIHQIEERFRRLGLDPGDRYLYTISFFELNDALANFLKIDIAKIFSQLGAVAAATRFGISVSPHLLVATVEKESVEYELVGGYPKCDGDGHGTIKPGSRRPITDWGGSPLFGFFADMGVGLGWNSKLLDPDLKTKTLGPAGATGVYELASAGDFPPAAFRLFTFRVIAIKGPAISVGNFTGFNAFSTVFFQADLLTENATLTTDRTTRLAVDPPHVPNAKDLASAKKQFEKWLKPSVDVTLASLSMGFGFAWRADSPPGSRQDVQSTDNTPPVSAAAVDKFQAFFNVDSDNVDESTNIHLLGNVTPTVRDCIEIAIAEHLLLFGSPNTDVTIIGYASPEYRSGANTTDERIKAARTYNLDLSRRRAVAVHQALLDAFGVGALPVKSVTTSGTGDAPALAAHLLDPNDSALSFDDWKQQNQDQVARWPEFRRVDVLINDRELFSVGG